MRASEASVTFDSTPRGSRFLRRTVPTLYLENRDLVSREVVLLILRSAHARSKSGKSRCSPAVHLSIRPRVKICSRSRLSSLVAEARKDVEDALWIHHGRDGPMPSSGRRESTIGVEFESGPQEVSFVQHKVRPKDAALVDGLIMPTDAADPVVDIDPVAVVPVRQFRICPSNDVLRSRGMIGPTPLPGHPSIFKLVLRTAAISWEPIDLGDEVALKASKPIPFGADSGPSQFDGLAPSGSPV